ncbi:MAG TPA: tetratricopeptide repeat protein [Anaeromyxobacter sp.]|nr:tetratricopeptide repeat protein [Anaeromyxobacter sp.]
MRLRLATLLCPLLLASTNSSPGENAGPRPEVEALLEQADAAYARRDQPGALEELRAKLEEASRLSPDNYEVLWREARMEFWMADDPSIPTKERSRLGKLAWEHGDRATQIDPDRVEGWNFAASGVGNYALGIGLLRAMGEGIEAKFKERLARAEKIDPDFESGAIQTAWGRFWFRLPWPKYDAKKSERALKVALEKNPDNVRARVYLSDVYAKEGHKDRAREELERALQDPPGRYDAPEERRMQQAARTRLDKL